MIRLLYSGSVNWPISSVRRSITGFLARCFLLLAAGQTLSMYSATRTWTNAAGGEWTTSANWSGGHGAGTGDQAKFTTDVTGAVTNAGSISVRYITIDAGARSIAFGAGDTGTITLGSGGDFSALASITATGAFTDSLNAPLVLAPASTTAAGSYAFKSSHTFSQLIINGPLSGGTTTASVTLTLTGSDANTGDNTVAGAIANGAASAGLSLIKASGNKWTLSNTGSTFTGLVSVNAGILSVPAIGTAGQPSPLGANSMINIGSTTTATLIYTGSGETTDKVLNLSGPGSVNIYSSGTGAVNFTADLTATGTGNKTLFLRGSFADASSEFAGKIVDHSSTDKTSLIKADTGRWTLSGASTFTGSVGLKAGVITVTRLGTAGSPSPLGEGSAIDLGNGDNAISFVYTGTGETSDKTINLAGTTGPVSIYGVGSGALVLTADFTATGAGSKSLYLRGENNGVANDVRGAIVDNSSTNRTSIIKSDGGSWRLLGTNTYTGKTTVNAGTLSLGDDTSSTPTYLSDSSDVYINDSGRMDLHFASSAAQESVRTLYLDNVPKAAGTWGPLGNVNATNHDAKLTGTGILLVGLQAPWITVAPVDRNVVSGTTVNFAVSATGTATLTYQWSKDGVPITGATSATLTLASVTEVDAGLYSVAITNSVAAISADAHLVIDNTPPSVPTGLYYTGASTSSILLRWLASTDEVGVTGYEIRQDAVSVGMTNVAYRVMTGLTALTVYEFTVRARDAAGNWSDWSAPFSVIGDPDHDADHDGLTNQEENLIMTDPATAAASGSVNLNIHRPQN